MRSDSFHEETHSERRGAPAGHTSEQDRREAKHWTKKLYDFEAGDPNRCVTFQQGCSVYIRLQ